jgi:hypothetical protein
MLLHLIYTSIVISLLIISCFIHTELVKFFDNLNNVRNKINQINNI